VYINFTIYLKSIANTRIYSTSIYMAGIESQCTITNKLHSNKLSLDDT